MHLTLSMNWKRTLLAGATAAALTTNGAAAQANAPASVPISFFGEVRARTEWDRPFDAASDAFTYLRSRFGVRIDPAAYAHILLQIQDSRVFGAEGSSSVAAAAADVFDLHQGYLELAAPWRAARVALRAGRQEIALGNERLVGAVNWSNTGRSFDGGRVILGPAPSATPSPGTWTGTAFAAVVDERGRHFGPLAGTATDPPEDHLAMALFASRTSAGGHSVDATLLYDVEGRYRSYDEAKRATFDVHGQVVRLGGRPLRLELEGAYQFGRQQYVAPPGTLGTRRQDVGAWLAATRLGTASPGARATLTIGADVLSGDASPTDGEYGTFNTMYATNHGYYGLTDVIAEPAATTRERGLADILAHGLVRLTPAVSVRAELHRFSLMTGDDRALGTEADVVFPVRFGPVAALDAGYGVFRAGTGAGAVGLGRTGSLAQWAFLQLGVSF